MATDKKMYLREDVLNKVLIAQSCLKNYGLDLIVYDGWRSIELQENLFWYYWIYENGTVSDLGVSFDCMKKNAGAFYHLNFFRKKFETNDQKVCINRSKLLIAMVNAGFSCYGPEFWHYNCGNQMDALVRGGIARYSYILNRKFVV